MLSPLLVLLTLQRDPAPHLAATIPSLPCPQDAHRASEMIAAVSQALSLLAQAFLCWKSSEPFSVAIIRHSPIGPGAADRGRHPLLSLGEVGPGEAGHTRTHGWGREQAEPPPGFWGCQQAVWWLGKAAV